MEKINGGVNVKIGENNNGYDDILENQLVQEEKQARLFGGFGIVFALIAMVFTAHQMAENPDGIYARYV